MKDWIEPILCWLAIPIAFIILIPPLIRVFDWWMLFWGYKI